uniref:Uncharacterized protein n=1 Tax=Romanomermis culicivorax TaxID=13658 RepID=A0A915HLD0_ROMCU
TNAKDNTKKPSASSNIKVKNEDPEKEKQHRQFLEAAAKRVEPKNSLKKPVATLAADFLAKHKGRTSIASASKPSAAVHSPSILSTSFGSNANASAAVVKTPSGESATTGLIGLSKLAVQQRSSTMTQPASNTSMSSSGVMRTAVKTTSGSSAVTSSNIGGSEVAAQKKLQMMKKKAAEKKNLIK